MNRDRNAQVTRLRGLGWTSWFVLCALVVPTGSLGEITFEKTYGGIADDWGLSVQQTPDGGYVVAGFTESFGAGSEDAYLIKTDPLGNAVWIRTYGGADMDAGHSVLQMTDSGYLVAGYTCSPGQGRADVYLVRTDSSGNTLWTRTYGGLSKDSGWFVQQTPDGEFIIAGQTGRQLWLIKTSASGDTSWTRKYGGSSWEVGQSVQPTSDGGYIVTGVTHSFGAGGLDMYLIKTESLIDTTCKPREPPQMRSQGYWRRQCKDDSHEDICVYVDSVHGLADLFDAFDCDSISDLMMVSAPERDMCRKARRQFMALLLNIASGKLAACSCLQDGREVGDMIAEIDSLLSGTPDFHTCEYAKSLADDINNGIVPCDTFFYPVPSMTVRSKSCSAAPNPFAGSTVIQYQLSVSRSARLQIYDKAGRLVRTLVDSEQVSGPTT